MYFDAGMRYIHAMRRKIPSTQALLAFEAAAHRGSFTLAGQDLSVSQSAVSHQILGLEQDLDVSLFLRLPRQLVLTDAGRSLLSRVSPALDALEAAMLDLASSKGEGGTLELGVVPTFATKWLIPRMPTFLKAHPHVTLNLSTRLLPFDFSLTGLDAAIHYGRPDWPGTESEYLMGEEGGVQGVERQGGRGGVVGHRGRPPGWGPSLVRDGPVHGNQTALATCRGGEAA